jgi:hypothetical protein
MPSYRLCSRLHARRFASSALVLSSLFAASFGVATQGGCSSSSDSATTTSGDGGAPGTACSAKPASRPDKDFFADVSERSGIQKDNFTPNPTVSIPINDHSRLAFVDIDGDGWDDVVMHSLFPNPQAGIPFEHLVFLNAGDGTFRDVSDESGLRAVQSAFLAFADVDNDGDEDAFAGLDIDLDGSTSQILHNDGNGHFAAKANAGVETLKYAANAVFADFDGDGKVDLFAGNGQSTYAVKNALLLGNGDGTFRDASSSLQGTIPAQPTNGLVACDYDNDGDLDVFVSTYGVSILRGTKQLWENQGDGTFVNVGKARGFYALATGNYYDKATGYGRDPQPSGQNYGANGFGLDCGDVDGDGTLDIWMATISHADGSDESRLWSDPTQLLLNGGEANGFSFTNVFLDRGLSFNEGDIDAAMVDYDNDGRMDLAVSRTDKYEANFTKDEQKGWFGLFRQNDDGTFESRGLVSGINDLSGDAKRMKGGQNLAFADIDHDGDADLLVGGRDQGGGRPNFLFENKVGQDGQWLAIQVRGDGTKVHRDAFGTRVTVRIGDRVVIREKKSSRGTYDSIDGSTLLFGLGDLAGCVEGKNQATIEIRWPDGTVDSYGADTFTLSTYLRATFGEKTLSPIAK